ncbi:MAG: zinc ABC transporter substrate-binding protein [Pseudomonadota bacterium]
MRISKSLLLASTMLVSLPSVASADVNVVASIKPIHSLVAAVMEGVGEPGLIVKGAGSPHTYSMRPSEAAMLQEADVVFWVGHDLEPFLEGPLENIAAGAKTVELMDAHDLAKLEFREGGAFDEHDHGDHGEEHAHDDHSEEVKAAAHSHDDHDHDHGHGHDHGEAAKASHDHDDHDHAEHGHDDHAQEAKAEASHDDDHDHGHDETADAGHDDHDHDHAGHAHGAFDPHVWLDPVNAKALVHEIEEALVSADPGHAAQYEANAEAVMARLDALTEEVQAEVATISGKGFIVFHDAYQYFEQRFGLEAAGSITVSPEVMPGAERLSELRDKVQDLGATCIFSEPQFEPRLVQTVAEGTQANFGVLDPLGAELTDGPELYFNLIRNMSTAFTTCLGGES